MAEIIVVGAGAIGNASAYYLAKSGAKVTVLEKDSCIGNGGSSRNGGGVRQSGRNPAELPAVMYGVRNIWPGLSDELGMDIEYCQEGNLRLGKTEEHLKILRGLVRDAEAGGLAMRMVDRAEAREICPFLSDEVAGASWCPTDGHANPLLVTLAFYRAARRLGVDFVTGAEAVSLRKKRGRVVAVVTACGSVYEGDGVLVAAGYGAGKLLTTAGIDVPMAPVLMEMLVTEEAPPMFFQMLGAAMSDFYGHQTKHGSFIFGGTHGFEAYTDSGRLAGTSVAASNTCRGVIGYFPVLKDLKILRTWAGVLDDCFDHIPVMDNPVEAPGLTVGCGFSGHGFGLAPVAGLLLSQLALGDAPALPLDRFKYDRFRAKVRGGAA
ncbi:MAG: FAD-binding oxidoreductase [Clostridiales Family XIII bacterium]|jgi:sarcosine oxidase subunit beta|nr:FAD-binding oxidoreductase [Clostridiales Family XIII bacterium]